ncbi:MAG TPA: DUF2630 family protein [Thermoleophilaceae bacterium]|jgi:hypothetical protein
MSDESIAAHIEQLVSEERELRGKEQADRPDDEALEADKTRLRELEVELDRCWDLLRQRRAKEEFGQDPDDAEVRSADTVEHYRQ